MLAEIIAQVVAELVQAGFDRWTTPRQHVLRALKRVESFPWETKEYGNGR